MQRVARDIAAEGRGEIRIVARGDEEFSLPTIFVRLGEAYGTHV